MKRDRTVTLSLLVLAGFCLIAAVTGDDAFTGGPSNGWRFHAAFWPVALALLRLFVLWIQTLIRAARPGDGQPARVVWIVALAFLGLPVSCLYYYFRPPGRSARSLADAEEDLKRRANEGRLG